MKKKKILIAPLDWGLGHATRCIPIARALEKENYEVLFCAASRSLDLLMKEFPNNQFIKLDGYNVSYPKNGWMIFSMVFQSFRILNKIRQEHKDLKQIITDFEIDGIISDNRYGMFNKKIPSIFITHQVNIQSPIFSKLIRKINLWFINKYQECWIPDTEQNILSGNLSKLKTENNKFKFIGPLSRFEKLKVTNKIDILAIVSGPEPQRFIFENLLKKQLIESEKNCILVLGKTESDKKENIGNLTILNHLPSKELNQAISNSEIVISRSGYSTIMDLAALDKKAIFIPTPGQTEQLYLANHFANQKVAFAQHQHSFNLEKALEESKNYSGFKNETQKNNLKSIFTIFEE
ncbi:glycosyltransferase [Flavobacteriales bacterium]|nr:glycosyltransferase [Flavobacteriales bacterium]